MQKHGNVNITLDCGVFGDVDFEVPYTYMQENGDRITPPSEEIEIDVISSSDKTMFIYESGAPRSVLDQIHTLIHEDVAAQIVDEKCAKADAENDRIALYREVD